MSGSLLLGAVAAFTLALTGVAQTTGSCANPPTSVVTDASGDQNPGQPAQLDIQSLSAGEDYRFIDAQRLAFVIKVANLNTVPANGIWRANFTYTPAGGTATSYYVAMLANANGVVRYEYGTRSGSTISPAGNVDEGFFTPDGNITLTIDRTKVGIPPDGTTLTAVNAVTQSNVGDTLFAGVDSTSNATYTIRPQPAGCTPVPLPAPPAQPIPPGTPRYHNFAAPPGMGNGAGEPTLGPGKLNLAGQPPSSGGPTMYIAGLETLRVNWDDCSSPAGALWENKTALTTPPATLDPILFTDFGAGRNSTNRTFVSQLGPKTSFLVFSDDNGQTYMQSQGSGINSGVDHQTIGGGPYSPNSKPAVTLYPNAIYYASQDAAIAQLARSDNGGQTFGPAVPMYNLTQCGGLHGHVKVAPDGTIYVPNRNCGGEQAVVVSEDNGLSFSIRKIPGSTRGNTDPSVGIDADGKLYMAMQDGSGRPKASVSADKGLTWSEPVDVGTAFGLRNAVFSTAVGGSSGRGAVQFLATTEPGDYQAINSFRGVWHSYASHTFDGGATWTTVRVSPENDPVQRGSICTDGTTCGPDRNLLDFNDMEIDHEGRILIAYADGCIDCTSPTGADSRSEKATIARQSGGKRLLAQFDPPNTALPGAPTISGGRNEENTIVSLRWSTPDAGDSPITAYNVYRKEGESGVYGLIATVPQTAYTDTSLNPAATNFYKVTAVNSAGEGPSCRDFSPGVGLEASACVLPGILAVNDVTKEGTDNDGGQNTPPDPRVNIKQLFVAEPDLGGPKALVFTLQLAPSVVPTAPPSSQWYIIWQSLNPTKDFDRYYVAMKSDASGAVSYEYGKFGVALPIPPPPDASPNANTPVKLGDVDAGTYDPVKGVITITLSTSKAENIGAGQRLADLNVRTFLTRPEVGQRGQNNANDITLNFDYRLVGNDACRPAVVLNRAPIAALTATPRIGDAPLTVTLDASASSDPDTGDNIASYTFNFGDGSPEVTQATPTIQHTYETEGNYPATVRVSDSSNTVSQDIAQVVIEVAPPDTAVNAKFYNISTRVIVEQGDTVGIGGFIIPGNQRKRVIMRGVGPSLQKDGNSFPGKLEDPTIELFDANKLLIDSNNDWRSSNETEIRDTNLAPSNDKEAAIVRELDPGAYTFVLTGNGGSTGVGLVEVYDLEGPTEAQLANLSTRGRVETGDRLLIGGIIVRGGNPQQIVVRAIGPSMTAKGVPDTLQNPQLELRDADGNLILANDNWQDTQAAEIQATGLAPEDSRESAIVRNLGAGVYTAIVFGSSQSTGNALVEAYNVGNP